MNKNDNKTLPLKYSDLPSHKYFALDPPEILYHYTDIKGAFEIIKSKSLWLTKIQYLNDKSELSLSIDNFGQVLNKLSSKIKDNDKKKFLYEYHHQLKSFEFTNLCVASFCENGDLLSQWRGYGKSGKGISLGFTSKIFERDFPKNKVFLRKCVYDLWQQEEIITDLIDNLLKSYEICSPEISDSSKTTRKDLIGYFNTLFLGVAPTMKNMHFSEEKEWRVILPQVKYTDKDFFATNLGERLIQYYNLDFSIKEK